MHHSSRPVSIGVRTTSCLPGGRLTFSNSSGSQEWSACVIQLGQFQAKLSLVDLLQAKVCVVGPDRHFRRRCLGSGLGHAQYQHLLKHSQDQLSHTKARREQSGMVSCHIILRRGRIAVKFSIFYPLWDCALIFT